MKIKKELVVVFIVTVLGILVNTLYLYSVPEPLENRYQAQLSHLYPAVFFAAGHGMGTADVEQIEGLPDFIFGQSDRFDTAHIPADIELAPLKSRAAAHLYLLYAVGWMWRCFGVSLNGLIFFLILMRTLNLILIYGMFRLVVRDFASAALALLFCLSPYMLYENTLIQYQVRAPFLFFSLWITLLLITRPWHRWMLIGLSVVWGIILGISVGFRYELVTYLPPALLVLFILTKVNTKQPFLYRAAATILCMGFFLFCSYPILFGHSIITYHSPMHTVLLGLRPQVEYNLAFDESSYEVMPNVMIGDSAALALVSSYARRKGVEDSLINKESAEYERYEGNKDTNLLLDPYLLFNGDIYAKAADSLVYQILWLLPSDFVCRAWEAVAAIPRQFDDIHRLFVKDHEKLSLWLRINLLIQEKAAVHLKQWGLLYLILVLVVYSSRHLYEALVLTAVLAWYGGYPSIMFAPGTGVYFVSVVSVFAVICFWKWLFTLMVKVVNKERRRSFLKDAPFLTERKEPIVKALCYVLITVTAIIVPAAGLRAWQTKQVHQLANQIEAYPRYPLSLQEEITDHTAMFKPKEPLPGLTPPQPPGVGETAWEYMVLALDTHGCDIPVTIHYDQRRVLNDYSETVVIHGVHDGEAGRVLFFFPVYELDISYKPELWRDFKRAYPYFSGDPDDPRPVEEQEWWLPGKFEGISIAENYQSQVAGLYRVEVDEDLEILPFMQIPQLREEIRPYKTGYLERAVRSMKR
ncbi:MAG: glycosyltransferase family 39 protein [Candidatus Hydrogenedentes bacterium]|jgi:hypothetical protein|nr:glycosyltransferase family 39 protein [Candidatus Hydrogenedentota bacterium]